MFSDAEYLMSLYGIFCDHDHLVSCILRASYILSNHQYLEPGCLVLLTASWIFSILVLLSHPLLLARPQSHLLLDTFQEIHPPGDARAIRAQGKPEGSAWLGTECALDPLPVLEIFSASCILSVHVYSLSLIWWSWIFSASCILRDR